MTSDSQLFADFFGHTNLLHGFPVQQQHQSREQKNCGDEIGSHDRGGQKAKLGDGHKTRCTKDQEPQGKGQWLRETIAPPAVMRASRMASWTDNFRRIL